MRELSASETGRHFGRIIDEIRVSGEPVLVTRNGRPMVEIRPALPGPEEPGEDTPPG